MTDQNLKILVIGSGGREHTIAKECAQSSRVDQVMVTPGNGGINREFVSFTVGVEDNEGIVNWPKNRRLTWWWLGLKYLVQWSG